MAFPLSTFVKSLLAFTLLTCGSLSAHAGQCTIDWSFLPPGAPVASDPYGERGAPVLIQSPALVNVVDAASAGSFPPGQLLSIAPKDGAQTLRIRIRPFSEPLAENGHVEFDFEITEGALQFTFGTTTKEWNPSDDWAYIDTARRLNLRLSAGEGIQAGSIVNLGTKDHPVLSSGIHYKLRITWETRDQNLVFGGQLNGLPLIDNDHKPLSISIPRASIPSNASLVILLQSGRGGEPIASALLGAIHAATMEN